MTWTLTPELTLAVRDLGEVQISPAGQNVAYTVGDLAGSDTARPERQLIVSEVARNPMAAGNSPTVVSSPGGHATSPRWSPDSAVLAYLFALPAGDHGLFVASPWTAPTHPLAPGLRTVSSPAWSPKGDRIAVLADPGDAGGDDPAGPQWWPAEPPARVWLVDLAAGPVRPNSPPGQHVWEYCWSPDGEQMAAVVSDRPGESDWFTCRLALIDADRSVDLVDGLAREPGEANPRGIYRQVAAPVWSPGGQHIAFIMGARSDREIVGGDLCVLDLRTGQLSNLTRGLPITVTSLAWTTSAPLTFAAYRSGRQAVGQVDLEARAPRILWQAPATFDRFWPRISMSETGRIATTREDPVTPREVWVADAAAGTLAWRQLSDVNRAARSWPHPTLHDLTWQAADGRELSGILLLPRPAAAPMPLVTWLHGGPTFVHKHLFYAAASPWMLGAIPELLTSAGIAVFLPNPRGSMGWGSEFAEAVIGDMGGADAADILSGIDECTTRFEDIDGTRQGVGGWSYGGFMSAWLITQTSRFSAAVVGAGTSNWRSQHGTSSVRTWDQQYLRDDPYRVGGAYDARSPLAYVRQATTPTLVAHGTLDSIVPLGQALEFSAGLHDACCPMRLSFYPGEGHEFTRRDTQIRFAEDVIGWFRRWLIS
ncbi:MAG: prolyl oligopeptidase family serine peptidase [Streptosporangiaceae bacterium]